MEENPLHTEFQTVNDGQNVLLDDKHYVSVKDGHNVSVDDGHNVSVDDGHNVSVDDGQNVSVDDGHNVSVNDGQNVSLDDKHYVSVKDGNYVSVDDGQNLSVDDEHNVSVNDGNYVLVYERQNVSVDDGHNVSVDDGHTVSVDGQNLSVADEHIVSVDDGRNVSVDDGNYVLIYERQNVSVDDGQNVSVDIGQNVSLNDGRIVSVDDKQNVPVYIGQNVFVDDGHNVSIADRFYRELDAKQLAFKFNRDELEDLQSAVDECILQILDRVDNINDRFKYKKVIRVGSFVEGTKILAPDEFDYLVVIEELSIPGVVTSVRCGKELPGYMTLQITDGKTQERWKDYCKDGHLLGFVLSDPPNIQNKSSNAVGFSSLIAQVYTNQSKEHPILISKPSGTLEFNSANIAYKDPNTVITMVWSNEHRVDTFLIKADISPAVRCYNVKQAVNEEECSYTNLYTKIQEHGSYLLTPKSCNSFEPTKYFRISLTEVEVDIVKSLDITHKTCYRVLKYILAKHLPSPILNVISSYVLKSAVLHHVADGQCQSSAVHTCVESVLNSLLNYLTSDNIHTRPFMPSVFIKGLNLFEQFSSYEKVVMTVSRICHVLSMKTLLNFTHKLCKIPTNNYDYASTIQMLGNGILDHTEAIRNAEKIAEQILDIDGNWDVNGMFINELFSKFVIPCKLLEGKRPDARFCTMGDSGAISCADNSDGECDDYTDLDSLLGLQVHLFGATTTHGLGTITTPEYFARDPQQQDRNVTVRYVVIEDIEPVEEVDAHFCTMGDGGAIICADTSDGEYAISMLIGSVNYHEVEQNPDTIGQYLTLN